MTCKRIFICITLLFIVLIFSFSFHSGASSHEQSEEVANVVTHVLQHYHMSIPDSAYKIYRPFLIKGETADRDLFFRKSAHLTEYFLLGVLSSILLYLGSLSGTWRPYQMFFFISGPVTALVDEKVIQQYLVIQRTSTFKDVMLDSIGFYMAVMICSTIYALIFLIIMWERVRRNFKQD